MELFLQQILNGLAMGSVYSLVALGLTLIYGTMHVPNFAHGHLYMLGAYVTFTMMTVVGVHYWLAALTAIAALAVVGVILERLVFGPLEDKPVINSMIAAVGLMLFLEALAQLIWGADYRRLDSPYGEVVQLGALAITQQKLILIGAAVTLMAALLVFLKRTTLGAVIEAVSQDREGAMLVGINVRRVTMLTFALSAALAAAAAALVAPTQLIHPNMGLFVTIKAFAVVVIGGMGSIPGAILVGFALALAESLGPTYLARAFEGVPAAEYQNLIAFVLLALVLAIRPTGLFGKEPA